MPGQRLGLVIDGLALTSVIQERPERVMSSLRLDLTILMLAQHAVFDWVVARNR